MSKEFLKLDESNARKKSTIHHKTYEDCVVPARQFVDEYLLGVFKSVYVPEKNSVGPKGAHRNSYIAIEAALFCNTKEGCALKTQNFYHLTGFSDWRQFTEYYNSLDPITDFPKVKEFLVEALACYLGFDENAYRYPAGAEFLCNLLVTGWYNKDHHMYKLSHGYNPVGLRIWLTSMKAHEATPETIKKRLDQLSQNTPEVTLDEVIELEGFTFYEPEENIEEER